MKCTPYSSIFAVTALISAIVASIAWRRRSIRGGRPLALMMVGVTEWALMAALEAATAGLPARILLSKLEYVGSNSATVFLLIFALEYARHDRWLTPRNIALLWVVPILNMGLAATNEWHGLVWTGFSPGPAGSNLLIYHHGPGFWFVMASVYVYLSVAALVLVRTALRPSALHRRQGTALLLASVAPWVGSAMYMLNMSPIPGLDIVPLSFMFTGLVLIWGIFHTHLLDLVPVARDTLIEHMSDGVLVLDAYDCIVDANPSARQLLARDESSLIGQPVGQVLETWPDIALQAGRGQASEVILGKSKTEPRFMDVRVSRVFDRKNVYVGHLVVLRDITELKRAEAALQGLNATLEARVAARTADAQAEKDKVETILRSVGDAIILADLEMRIQYVNRAFTTLTGYSADETLGRPVAAAGVGVAPEQVLESIASALSQGQLWQGEVEGQSKDGRTFDAALTVAPVYGAGGQIEGCVSSLRDISRQRELERARTRFMTNVSHELRTPVTSIKISTRWQRKPPGWST
jgi:PAS domain S-box-containing protein